MVRYVIALILFVLILVLCVPGYAQPYSGYTPDVIPTILLADSLHYEVIATSPDSAILQVYDEDGNHVEQLSKQQVRIESIDGVKARVLSVSAVRIPHTRGLSLNFVLDNSSSMFSAYDSLTRMLDSLVISLPKGLVVSAVTFDNIERTRDHEFTNRKELFIAPFPFSSRLDSVSTFWHFYDSIRTDFTPLFDAVATSLRMIQEKRKNGDTNRVEVIVVVSDGTDNASSTTYDVLRRYIQVSPVTLYIVNYRTEPDRRLMTLMRRTRGRNFYASNLPEMRKCLLEIRKELVSGFVVRYQFPPLLPIGSE